ncbi:hypothetical protein MJ017_05395 [Acinetobacter baumannii]|uniref:hypothetical protein n=1 Tax=Acinetobacter baumannii TaxID=470 RepID=UPI0022EA6AA5|nr:hypothetical protein [Acinetobacter baumannii]MDA3319806.1 hypothetical protein [Acinetobacter baumannii]MDA3435590.1 hypothetical protein [Acinetobacter baumannii]
MKPEQFIREYGLDKARDLLDQLHKLGCPDDMKITVINGMWQRTSNGFTYPELKRLVESVDLVDSLGGLKAARSEAHKDCFVFNQPLLAAIAAYESIYGGGDES